MQLLWIAEPFVIELVWWYIIRTITWKSGIAMLKVKTTVTGLGQTWEVNRSKWGLDPWQEYLCFIFHWYVGASFPDNVGLCFSTVLMTQKRFNPLNNIWLSQVIRLLCKLKCVPLFNFMTASFRKVSLWMLVYWKVMCSFFKLFCPLFVSDVCAFSDMFWCRQVVCVSQVVAPCRVTWMDGTQSQQSLLGSRLMRQKWNSQR